MTPFRQAPDHRTLSALPLLLASTICLPLQATAQLATRLAAASPAAAAALADSSLVGSLAALLEAPSTEISPNAKWDALGFFRRAASRPVVREAVSCFLHLPPALCCWPASLFPELHIQGASVAQIEWPCATPTRSFLDLAACRWMKRVPPPPWCLRFEGPQMRATGRSLPRPHGHWS